MEKSDLQALSTEELRKKEKQIKTLIIIFIFLFVALCFFPIRDYFNGEEVKAETLIIPICTLGGLFSVTPELKKIREVLLERNA